MPLRNTFIGALFSFNYSIPLKNAVPVVFIRCVSTCAPAQGSNSTDKRCDTCRATWCSKSYSRYGLFRIIQGTWPWQSIPCYVTGKLIHLFILQYFTLRLLRNYMEKSEWSHANLVLLWLFRQKQLIWTKDSIYKHCDNWSLLSVSKFSMV